MLERTQKIKLLKAIQAGIIKAKDIQDTDPALGGGFVVYYGQESPHLVNGKELSESEFKTFLEDVESRNKVLRSIGKPEIILWEEIRTYE